ncbi:hypothetical protein ERO13_A13G109200v2 [Gossypium hirsutum]|uniref:Uncharacterized protein n=4 Tax=Gossypium TaxID=3633 RepID=A0A1U8I7J3_GOSHI|nr:uncharacterized protein LOC107893633 [Gossypium hirsutum]KAB2048619.1 hypothetical protein ES319_A13G124100v1 [Gossypium barbadense]KAG4166075.1 hypothetical protein ERO13_A13G109200v2 [Gossypium hirsutum]TYG86399.1 hypothetical protein ES288_A13G131300v1 [Gossypium darwinii]TYH91724.1 hypothetical protein ES332_A13G133400v1 [Gossypium tomentosum]
MPMGCPFLSLRFSLFLSLSFATSSSPFSFFKLQSPSSSIPKATPSDLLSLLATPSHSSSVNPSVADELKSCFKFLVPFNPSNTRSSSDFKSPSSRRSLLKSPRDEQNELIWWPPEPVLELARLAFDSGGGPDSIHRALDPTVMPVPDVEGSKEDKCELTRTPYGRRFISQELNSYLEYLFKLIVERGPDVGLKVSLNRYDLFHGHLFIATETGRLGILFHAKEYPLYDKQVFPYYLGYCQKDSNVTYDDSINLRNILWLAPLPSNSTQGWIAPGVLLVLDAHPGGIVYRDLIPEYVNVVRTIYEDDLGNVVVDVNYLNVGDSQPDYQIFIC